MISMKYFRLLTSSEDKMKKIFLFLMCLVMGATTVQSQPLHFARIDVNHSTIGFSVPILMGISKVTGKFTDFSIDIFYDVKNISQSSVNVKILTKSIDTGVDKRDEHMRGVDFFDVNKYPEATFVSKRIEKHGEVLRAVGDFTLKDITEEVVIEFCINGLNKRESSKTPGVMRATLGLSASFTLDRQDYGFNWQHSSVPAFVGNSITVEIELKTRSIKL